MLHISTKIFPYVYKLTHKNTGQFYIGYRKSITQKLPSNEDIMKYKSSSKLIKELGFPNFEVEIIAEFFDGISAYDFEQELIYENFKNPLCLNRMCHHNAKNRFIKCNYKKFSDIHKFKISINHHDVSGTNNPFYGKKHSEGSKIKISARDYSMVSGSNNIHSKRVIINGIGFDTVRSAGKFLNINENTLRDYLKCRRKLSDKIWQADYI